MTEAFTIRRDEWLLMLDGKIVPTTFNSKGAAEAAIPVERKRRETKVVEVKETQQNRFVR